MITMHAVDVDHAPAPAGAEFVNQLGKFGMLLLLDQRYARHALSPVHFGRFKVALLSILVDRFRKTCHSGAPQSGEPGNHKHKPRMDALPVVMDSGSRPCGLAPE